MWWHLTPMSDGLLTKRDIRDRFGDAGQRRALLFSVVALPGLLAACAPSASRSPSPHAVSPAPLRTPATPAPSPAPADPLSGCPKAVSFSALPVVARMAGADDLAAAPDGSIWISDARAALEHHTLSGTLLQRIADPRIPEGIVVLSDGSLLVAEQGPDRVVQLQPSSGAVRTVVQLTPRSGVAGVDGIAYQPETATVLIPDSPNGTLLSVPLAGGAPARLATGLGRPVGVAVLAEAGFAVAAEDSTGLFHVAARGGAITPLAGVTQGDDVVASGRLAYVTSLTTHQLIAVDPATARTRMLVSGDPMPQGLAVLPDGSLVLSDSSSGAIVRVGACG
jgi:sugar lactone lactonase YvrE